MYCERSCGRSFLTTQNRYYHWTNLCQDTILRMVATSTVENYLKTLFTEQQRRGGDLVPMGALATAMRVAPGTVTAMVKTLAESGLADYEPRGGVKLSSKGERLALHVLRRHRLVEQF